MTSKQAIPQSDALNTLIRTIEVVLQDECGIRNINIDDPNDTVMSKSEFCAQFDIMLDTIPKLTNLIPDIEHELPDNIKELGLQEAIQVILRQLQQI